MPNTRDALLENIRYISSQISFVIKIKYIILFVQTYA